MLVYGVDGHLRYVFGSFGLDVQRDQPVCYQVVDGLETFLPDEMLPIVKETEVSGLIPKAERKTKERKTVLDPSAITDSCETIQRENMNRESHTHLTSSAVSSFCDWAFSFSENEGGRYHILINMKTGYSNIHTHMHTHRS